MNMTARVVAKMACWSVEKMAGSDLQYYLTWLKDQLRMQGNEYIQSVARCLQMMLRIDDYRQAFVAVDGINTLVSVLSGRVNFQVAVFFKSSRLSSRFFSNYRVFQKKPALLGNQNLSTLYYS